MPAEPWPYAKPDPTLTIGERLDALEQAMDSLITVVNGILLEAHGIGPLPHRRVP